MVSFALVACGNNSGDARSGGGGMVQTTQTGASIEVTLQKSIEPAGEQINVNFDLRNADGSAASGTIGFGDGVKTRISGTGVVRHIYADTGTYEISIQIDGEQDVVVGTVTIESTALNNENLTTCQPDVEVSSADCLVPTAG